MSLGLRARWQRLRAHAAAPAEPVAETRTDRPVPRELLDQVRRIELRMRGLVDSLFSGEYHSVFRGQGMEFAEVREYQPGDDVRNIDWNVTARMAAPYVKKHIEERELTVLLAVDLSGSEQFGTRGRFKAEAAAEIAAVLALSAIRNNDRVGMIVFTDSIEHVVPPRKGKRHALRLIRDVLAFRPQHRGTDIGAALDYAARLLPHRGIIFLLSDFVQPRDSEREAAWESTLRLVSRRHDVVAVRIADGAEHGLPAAGLLVLHDPETGDLTAVDTDDPRIRRAYEKQIRLERDKRERLFRRLGVDEIAIRTDSSIVAPLLGFFRRRERRLRR